MFTSRREFLGLATLFTQIHPLTHALGKSNNPIPETDNPYLESIYEPTFVEQKQEIELQLLQGKIPDEISGTYFRNGPNPIYKTNPHHWFDGDGMIHKISIHGGRAKYQSRMINTWAASTEKKWGKIFPGLYEASAYKLPTMGLNFLMDGTPLKDTSNTDVIYFRDQLISLWWLCGKPYAMNPRTLEPQGIAQFRNYSGNMSAHARIDPRTQELFFLNFNFSAFSPWVKVCALSPDGSLNWTRTFKLRSHRIFHDILFTKNYVILLDFPVGYQVGENSGIRLNENEQTRIVLVPRDRTREEVHFYMDPCYVLHGLNAFESEDGRTVELTVNRFVDPFLPKPADYQKDIPYVGALRVETRPCRWILDLSTKKIVQDHSFLENTEFPRINDAFLGNRSRYSYHPKISPSETVQFGAVVKYDWNTLTSQTLELGAGKVGEEFVFIPKNPNNGNDSDSTNAEDDGWIATLVHSVSDRTQTFDIFDAKSFDPNPVAQIAIPPASRIPAGFHCKWVSNPVSSKL